MVTQVTATEAKAKLLSLLNQVEKGEEIEITRRGKPIARLRPTKRPQALLGMFEGIVTSNATDEELFSTGDSWEVEEDDATP
jgi:prevent-host-death family protein